MHKAIACNICGSTHKIAIKAYPFARVCNQSSFPQFNEAVWSGRRKYSLDDGTLGFLIQLLNVASTESGNDEILPYVSLVIMFSSDSRMSVKSVGPSVLCPPAENSRQAKVF